MKKIVLLFVSLVIAVAVDAQSTRRVSGIVIDGDDGQPLAGASVRVIETGPCTASDVDGRFVLNVPAEGKKIMIAYIGKKTVEVDVASELTVTLYNDARNLDDVVVIAYGNAKRRNLTSAISSVKGDELEKAPVASLEQAMQGRLSGVQVTSASGAPGGAVAVSVRGTGSFSAGNSPLYVVDGMPINSSDITQKGGYQGASISGVIDINPNDIESIEVLKDASASTLYGSRATNGVILITTKKGRADRTKVSFSGYVGWQDIPHRIELLNATDYINARNEAIDNYNTSLGLSEGDAAFLSHVSAANEGVDTDWRDEVTQSALIGSAQLSVSGGNEKTKFFLSGGYFYQEGVIKFSDYKRFNLRSNIRHQISCAIGIEANVALSSSENTRTTGDNNIYSPWNAAHRVSPDYAPYNADGSYASTNNGTYNPVQLVTEDADQNGKKYRAIINLKGRWNIIDGLTYTLNLGGDYSILHERGVYPSTSVQGAASNGEVGDYRGFTFTDLFENTFDYKKTFGEVDFSALVGYSYQYTKVDNNYVKGINFLSPSLEYITSAGEISSGSSSLVENALQSVFGRVNAVWKDRYIAEFSLRADASSKFAPKHRTGYFPAGSLAWRISEESFFPQNNILSDLKLRGSIGYTGNQEGISNYGYFTVYSADGSYSGNPGLTFGYYKPNPDLTWEKALQYDLGVDLSLFNGRLDASLDWYRKDTEDLLMTHSINSLSGYASQTSNVGSISNTGIELSITSHNINTRNLRWDTTFNLSWNKNEVTGLNKNAQGEDVVTTTGWCNILKVGEPFAAFYLIKQDGIYQSKEEILAQPGGQKLWDSGIRPGDVKYYDKDGNGVINSDDREIVGSPFPSVYGSLLNTFSYRGFDFSIDLQYSLGSKIYAGWKHGANGLANQGGNSNGYSIFAGDWNDRWTSESPSNEVPRAVAAGTAFTNNYKTYSTRFLEDGDFLRIRNITFGYTFPSELTRKISIEQLRLYFTVANLYTFTKYDGYDPELAFFPTRYDYRGYDAGSVPQLRSFTFGLNVSF